MKKHHKYLKGRILRDDIETAIVVILEDARVPLRVKDFAVRGCWLGLKAEPARYEKVLIDMAEEGRLHKTTYKNNYYYQTARQRENGNE